MAIRHLTDIPRESLAGKYICIPSRQADLVHGWPARIDAATAAKLTYRRLPRGVYDPDASSWLPRPTFERAASDDTAAQTGALDDGLHDDGTGHCMASSVRFVCDTAEEAIALHLRAVATEQAISRNRRIALAELDATALAGELPVPAHLTTHLA
jgi:hypothetical protein